MAFSPPGSQLIAGDGQAVALLDFVFPGAMTIGRLVQLKIGKADAGGNVLFVLGDCVKQAGTATISAITLDKQSSFDLTNGGSAAWSQVGFYSSIVTGAGTLTLRVTMTAGTYCLGVAAEFPTSLGVDASRVESAPAAATSATDITTSTSVSGPAVTSAAGGLVVGALGLDANGAITITPTSGTQLAEQENGSSFLVGSAVYSIIGAGAFTPTWTVDPGAQTVFGFNNITVLYKEIGGGPAQTLMGAISL